MTFAGKVLHFRPAKSQLESASFIVAVLCGTLGAFFKGRGVCCKSLLASALAGGEGGGSWKPEVCFSRPRQASQKLKAHGQMDLSAGRPKKNQDSLMSILLGA